ncbi:MAG: hypothetical protein VW739_04300 [Pelagibacteraceae bacterium]
MALKKLTTIRVFPNDPDKKASHGNSNWKPYSGKEPCDLVLSKDVRHSISVFQNDDGSMDVVINERTLEDYKGADSISDNVRQGGMKKLAASVEQSRMTLTDDDVPF